MGPAASPGARTVAAAALVALLGCGFAVAGCGYALSTRWVGRGGVERVEVVTFENRSTEQGLGAAVTEAVRVRLARRGAEGEGDARLEGEVRARPAAPSSAGAATWRITLEVRARLLRGSEVLGEQTLTRQADYVGGADPVEAEGRRALALRRLADELAAELVAAFER